MNKILHDWTKEDPPYSSSDFLLLRVHVVILLRPHSWDSQSLDSLQGRNSMQIVLLIVVSHVYCILLDRLNLKEWVHTIDDVD